MVGRGRGISGICAIPKPGSPKRNDIQGGGDHRFDNLQIQLQLDSDKRKIRALGGGGGDDLPSDWDPMKDDYENPNFNSYDRGPGLGLPKAYVSSGQYKKPSVRCKLFVGGIPAELNETGLRGLFGRWGNVQDLKICTKPGQDKKFGFVTYSCFEEAVSAMEDAPSGMNRFQIGGSVLNIKFALSPEERDERKRRAQEHEEFQRSLGHPTSRFEGKEHRNGATDRVYDEQKDKKLEEVRQFFETSFTDQRQPTSRSEHVSSGSSSEGLEHRRSFGASIRGRGGYHGHYTRSGAGVTSSQTGCNQEQDSIDTPVTSPEVLPVDKEGLLNGVKAIRTCQFCGTEGAAKRCSSCKTRYCSQDCQKRDWEGGHKNTCSVQKETTPENAQSAFERRFETDFDLTFDGQLSSAPATPVNKPAGVRLHRKDLPTEKLPLNTPSTVELVHVNSPDDFYVVPLAELRVMKGLQEELRKVYQPTGPNAGPSSFMPEINEICAAWSERFGEWYRVELLEMLHTGTVRVKYIDFGNSEEVHVKQLRKLHPVFQQTPIQAVHCRLEGLFISSTQWTDKEVNSEVLKVLQPGKYTANAQQIVDDVFHIRLFNQEDVDIARRLTSVLAKSQRNESKASAGTETIPKKATNESPAKFQDLPDVPKDMPSAAKHFYEGKDLDIEVLELDNPSEWWIQVIDEKASKALLELKRDMTNYYSKLKPNNDYKPGGCSIVACRYRADEDWYRARVTEFDTKNVTVRYVDYGNTDQVPFRFVQSLHPPHRSLPFQAFPISLIGIKPTGGEWSGKAAIFLFNKIIQKKLKGKVHKADAYSAILDVFVEGKSVSKILIEGGFAEQIKCGTSGSTDVQKLPIREACSAGITSQVSSKGHSQTLQVVSTQQSQRTRHRDMHREMDASSRAHPMDISYRRPDVPKIRDSWSRTDNTHPSYSNLSVREKDRHVKKLCLSDLRSVEVSQELILVQITEILGDRFYVQPCIVDIEKMNLELHELNKYPKDPEFLRESDLVCAKFAGDRRWHRAVIVDVLYKNSFKVQYIDYGNVETVERENLRPFHPSLRKYPVFGVICSLQRIRANVARILEPLKRQHLLMKKNGITKMGEKPMYIVDLIDQRTGKSVLPEQPGLMGPVPNIMQRKVEENRKINTPQTSVGSGAYVPKPSLVPLSASSSCKEQDATTQFPVRNQSQGPTRIGIQNSALVKSTPHTLPVNSTVPKVPVKDDVKRPILNPGETVSVAVTDNSSPNNITVQVDRKETLMRLEEVTHKLQKVSENYSGSYVPSCVGELVCAKFSEDSIWYRAEVQSIDEEKSTVRFLDFGNVDTCATSSLMAMPKDLSVIPACGISVSLESVEAVGKWEPGCLDIDETVGRLQMKVFEKISSLYVVDFLHPSSCESYTEQLLTSGRLRRISAETSVDDKRIVQLKTEYQSDLMTSELPMHDDVRVLVWFINSPTSFYVQCCEDSLSEFQTMTVEMAEMLSETNSESIKVKEGCLYAAQSSDGAWYRAKAVSVSPSAVNVFFIDFGNYEEVPLNNIRELEDRFQTLPAQALHCGVHGVTGTNSEGIFSQEALEWFSSEGLKMGFAFISHKGKEGDKYRISKIRQPNENGDQVSVIEEMINMGYARASGDDAENKSSESSGFKYKDLPQVKIPKDGDVAVTDLRDPENFYVTLYSSAQVEALQNLEDNVTKHCLECEEIPQINSHVGDICCAFSKECKGWYRGVILSKDDSCYEVLFFDYGNKERISRDNTRRISDTLMQQPPFGLRCSLKGLRPNGQTYCANAIQTFSELVLDKLSWAEFVDDLEDRSSPFREIVHSVLLTTEGSDVAQKLIQKQLAKDLKEA